MQCSRLWTRKEPIGSLFLFHPALARYLPPPHVIPASLPLQSVWPTSQSYACVAQNLVVLLPCTQVSQRQFASGLENVGIYSGRTTLWTREGSTASVKNLKRSPARRKMTSTKTNKKSALSWTLTLSRVHMTRLFEVVLARGSGLISVSCMARKRFIEVALPRR